MKYRLLGALIFCCVSAAGLAAIENDLGDQVAMEAFCQQIGEMARQDLELLETELVESPSCRDSSSFWEIVEEAPPFPEEFLCSEDEDCAHTGCSGQLCAAAPIITTCEFRCEYGCYNAAACVCQGIRCAFRQSRELRECLLGCEGKGLGRPDESPGGAPCGPNTCDPGQVCCNESCGICTPPGGVCTQQLCS